ncbi:PQQ-dependent sugar dehydrogenase [Bacillus marasmi]|uniref:PQQ-dependent sugar dehydrogenase n=1 Tax=Bacillus marasmi TaxID=1926279 RepID=UPI0011C70C6E|nr:PQQ-dependent sugar dehydrogenase [Bacillus marasmi]
MVKSKLLLILLLSTLIGCSANTEQPRKNQEESVIADRSQPTVVAENIKIPWSIAKSGDTFYISERNGHVVKVAPNGEMTRQKVKLTKRLATAAEAGLLGFVLAPDFQKTHKAFAYYTYENGSGQYNRIIELQLTGNEWSEVKVLLDKIPSGAYHHGGRLELGPDGYLYATTGDAARDPKVAQDIASLGGKILRMNLDGTIPSDNPIPNSYVYSLGHRNPQGLAWSAEGVLFESEHGPSAHDEINKIEPGKNYGWPEIVGGEEKIGMESPLFESGEETWAPSGMAYDKNKLYVATLRGNAVREFDVENKTTRILVNGLGRIRDVFIVGDTLYFISNNTDGRGTPTKNADKLYKIELTSATSDL